MTSISTATGQGSRPYISSLQNGVPQEAGVFDPKLERPFIADVTPPRPRKPSLRLLIVKVGINLTDPVFYGVYHGKKIHEDDLEDVLQRAIDVGCRKFMVTGSSLEESKKAVRLAKDKRLCLLPRFLDSQEYMLSFISRVLLRYCGSSSLLVKRVR